MTDDERVQVARIAQAFEDFVRQYAKDEERKEQQRIEERDEKRIFRDDMIEKVAALEKKIAPVVFHHQLIVKGGTWLTSAAVGTFGIIKGIFWVKDHLKP